MKSLSGDHEVTVALPCDPHGQASRAIQAGGVYEITRLHLAIGMCYLRETCYAPATIKVASDWGLCLTSRGCYVISGTGILVVWRLTFIDDPSTPISGIYQLKYSAIV